MFSKRHVRTGIPDTREQMGKVRVSTCHDSITDENHAHGMLKLPSRQWQRMHPHKSIQPCVHADRRHSCTHLAAPRCAASQPSPGTCALYKNTYTVSKHASSRARVCAHARNISTHNAHTENEHAQKHRACLWMARSCKPGTACHRRCTRQPHKLTALTHTGHVDATNLHESWCRSMSAARTEWSPRAEPLHPHVSRQGMANTQTPAMATSSTAG